MPTHGNHRDPAQRRPSLATDTEGRIPRAEAWAGPGSLTACGQMLYKGKESELLRQHALRTGRCWTHRRVGGPYVTTSS